MMKKKTIYRAAILMVVIAALILAPSNINAATISENGKYTLLLDSMFSHLYINGNSVHAITFDFDEGEETVSVEELTKGVEFYSSGRKFLGLVDYFDRSKGYITELKKSDFNSTSTIGTSEGEKSFLQR